MLLIEFGCGPNNGSDDIVCISHSMVLTLNNVLCWAMSTVVILRGREQLLLCSDCASLNSSKWFSEVGSRNELGNILPRLQGRRILLAFNFIVHTQYSCSGMGMLPNTRMNIRRMCLLSSG